MEKDQITLILGELRSDTKTILRGLNEIKARQDKHEGNDSDRIAKLHERIDGMNKYAASVAIVACSIGAGFKALYGSISNIIK